MSKNKVLMYASEHYATAFSMRANYSIMYHLALNYFEKYFIFIFIVFMKKVVPLFSRCIIHSTLKYNKYNRS